jgi:hypothetical protein
MNEVFENHSNVSSDFIDQFFLKDGELTEKESIRKSIILAAQKDMAFLSGEFFEKLLKEGKITDGLLVNTTIENNLPRFSYLLTFFAAIDCISRVMKKENGLAKPQSKKKFLYSSINWFNFTKAQAAALWDIRNGLSHHYHLGPIHKLTTQQSIRTIVYRKKYKDWVLYINTLSKRVENAKMKAYRYIRSLKKTKQDKYSNYIKNNGFYYTEPLYKQILER